MKKAINYYADWGKLSKKEKDEYLRRFELRLAFKHLDRLLARPTRHKKSIL